MIIGCLFCNGVFHTQESFHEHLIQFVPELLSVSGLPTARTDNYHVLYMIREYLRATWNDECGLLHPPSQNPGRRAVLAEFGKHVGQRLDVKKKKKKGTGKQGGSRMQSRVQEVVDRALAISMDHSDSSEHGTEVTETGIETPQTAMPDDWNVAVLFILNVNLPNRVMIPIDVRHNTTLTEALTAAIMHEKSVFRASSGGAAGFVFVGNHSLVIGDVEWEKLKKGEQGTRVVTVRLKRAAKSAEK